jgi:arylsulfatase A-like enzyme
MPESVSRRTFLAATAVASAATAADRSADRPAKRPNLIFIMTDQQRFDALGANGNPLIQTPNLDRLAERSANFQNAFVQAPVCVPARATWFTGRYPHAHRNRVNYTPLKRDEVLLQQRLKATGYRTASVGKLHLHPPTADEARRSGFDRVLIHDGVRRTDAWSDYVTWRNRHDPQRDVHYRALAENIPAGKNPFRSAIAREFTDTHWTALKAREFIDDLARQDDPFYLYVGFWKPHSPYEIPEPLDAMYDDVEIPLPRQVTLEEIRKLPLPVQKMILRGQPQYGMDRRRLQWIYRSYYAAVTEIDREIGLLLDVLERTGKRNETIVVVGSDHGDQLLEHGLVGKNVFYESSIRIPFLFSFPGKVRPKKYTELIETTDFVPSLLELVGLPEPYLCQGRSFVPLIAPSDRPYTARDTIHAENIIPEVFSTRTRFEKGKGVDSIRHPDAKMVRTERWKLNYYPKGSGELYDLKNDPNEDRNLYADPQHKGTVADMKDRILAWLTTADETEQIAEKWLL